MYSKTTVEWLRGLGQAAIDRGARGDRIAGVRRRLYVEHRTHQGRSSIPVTEPPERGDDEETDSE